LVTNPRKPLNSERSLMWMYAIASERSLLFGSTLEKLQPLGKLKLTPKAGSLKSICEPETGVTDCATEGNAATRQMIETRRME